MQRLILVDVSKESPMEHNKKLIEDFIKLKTQQRLDKKRINDYKSVLLSLKEWAKDAPFEEICKDQRSMVAFFAELKPRQDFEVVMPDGKLRKFKRSKDQYAANTMYFRQLMAKTFIRWLYGMSRREEPQSMNWVKKPTRLGRKLTKDQIWMPVEVKALCNAADNARDRAIPHALFESMCRNDEFRQWNLDSLQIKEDYAKVSVQGKGDILYTTYLVHSLPAIKQWCELHPLKGKKEPAPMWISMSRNGYGKRLTANSLNLILKRLAARAGINKEITAHSLRHAGITWRIREGYNVQLVKKMCGHKAASNVILSTYTHLFDSDAEEEIRKKNGLNGFEKPKPELEKVVCPRCGKTWPPGQRFCSCNWVLDPREAMKKEEKLNEKEQAGLNLLKLAMENEEHSKKLAKLLATVARENGMAKEVAAAVKS